MHRNRIMDRATNLMLSKIRHQSLSLRAGNDVKVINVLSVRALLRRLDRHAAEAKLVLGRDHRAPGIVGVQIA